MVDNSNIPHPKRLGSQKNPGTEPKTCEKGPKLGFEYLPISKTSHCVHGIPHIEDGHDPLVRSRLFTSFLASNRWQIPRFTSELFAYACLSHRDGIEHAGQCGTVGWGPVTIRISCLFQQFCVGLLIPHQ